MAKMKGGQPLACERMVNILEEIAAAQSRSIGPGLLRLLERWLITRGLRMLRRIKSKLPGSHNRPEIQRHRYPGLPTEQLRSRLTRFQRLLEDRTQLSVEPVTATIYRISPANLSENGSVAETTADHPCGKSGS